MSTARELDEAPGEVLPAEVQDELAECGARPLAAAIRRELAAVAKLLQDTSYPSDGPAGALRDALSVPFAAISRLVEDSPAEATAEAESAAERLAAIIALCRCKAAKATLDLGFWIHPRNVRVDAADVLKIIGGVVPPLTGDEISAAAGAREAAP